MPPNLRTLYGALVAAREAGDQPELGGHHMSTFGLRTAQYENAAALAKKVERLVAQVRVGTPATAQTRLQLAPLIDRIGQLLRPHNVGHISAADSVNFPGATMRRLRRERVDGRQMADALPEVADHLRATDVAVSEADLRVLENVVSTVGREAAVALARVLRR